ncbi:hypothetical protein MJA45_25450 [Paenibacillus aurantius]|uniref:Uncharacterized protein n=1 Tax=Paenibacillus aurantius TaxID=2918900 RepID=A0AA96LF29_9BACL|nr:hypothetical protein [Paenibacillus aurantius]WNQ10921.1 hypothetical protein MJA45_25450 [Paenibacillus aurantius]
MSNSKQLKWITGGLEAVLGIPFVGGLIVLSLAWVPLGIMLVLHIITLLMASKEGGSRVGSVVGIVTSVIAFIPVVGMIMHILTAVILLIDAARKPV